MNRITIITLALLMLFAVSCKQEQATIYSPINKYAIQDDTNWVEVTDIDTVNICLGSFYWNYKSMVSHSIIIKNENEYKAIFDDALATTRKDFLPYCDTVYKPTGVDFNNRFMIMYSISGGDSRFTRRIFYSKNLNEYLYLTTIEFRSGNEILRGFSENISLPKINEDTKIIFDTLNINIQ